MNSVVKKIAAALGGAGKAAADVRGAVENIRGERLRLLDEREEIEGRATPRAEAIAALDAGLDRLADQAVDAISITSLVRPAGSPSFNPNIPESSLFGLLVAAHRDAIKDVIVDRLDDFLAGHASMSMAEKAAAIAKIDEELSQLELAEEAAIRAAEAAGLSIERREDASPFAVLAADAALT